MIRDPFNVHRNNVLRTAATQAAENIRHTTTQVVAAAADMAFSVPRQVPDFADPSRGMEDRAWTSLGSQGGSHAGLLTDVKDKVTGLFEDNSLPMYKDKPFYATSNRYRPHWKRKRSYGLIAALMFLLYVLGVFSSRDKSQAPASSGWKWLGLPQEKGKADWDQRRQSVVEAFELSWDSYERYAWGRTSLAGRETQY